MSSRFPADDTVAGAEAENDPDVPVTVIFAQVVFGVTLAAGRKTVRIAVPYEPALELSVEASNTAVVPLGNTGFAPTAKLGSVLPRVTVPVKPPLGLTLILNCCFFRGSPVTGSLAASTKRGSIGVTLMP